jgi:RNA polymerase sigma factor (TIGR02999 family)
MSEVTRILNAIEQGDPAAAEQLLPVVYEELRRLAAQKLAQEKPGQTLQPTALVHEAYLRLVASPPHDLVASLPHERGEEPHWHGRAHFFAAAAEAMRRILIESARRKAAVKHGGQARRVELDEALAVAEQPPDELLELDDALAEFEQHDPLASQLVKFRYFAGLTHQQAAETLGITRRAADRLWTLARAWLHQRLQES